MKFVVEFSTDNAAFQDALGNWEIATILHKLAERVASDTRTHVAQDKDFSVDLRDSNGNVVGSARTEDDTEVQREFLEDGRCAMCGEEHYVIDDRWVCPGCDYECFYCGNATLTGIGEPNVRCGTCGSDYDLTYDNPLRQGRRE